MLRHAVQTLDHRDVWKLEPINRSRALSKTGCAVLINAGSLPSYSRKRRYRLEPLEILDQLIPIQSNRFQPAHRPSVFFSMGSLARLGQQL